MQAPDVQTAQTMATWLRDAGTAGIVFILGAIIYGLLKKDPWLVPAGFYKEKKEECDRLQIVVNNMAHTTNRAVGRAEQTHEG